MVFKTQRLIIGPIALEDAPFILELMNTPKWIQFIGDRNVKTVEAAKAYIKEKALPQLNKYGYGNNVVLRKKDHSKLGTCGVYHREGKDHPDIGFAFLPEHTGKGYAFEANYKLMYIMRDEYGLKELNAYTMEDNLASRKLLEYLGFSHKGIDTLPDSDEKLLHYHRFLYF